MAVLSSATLNMAGKMRSPARKYARTVAGPAWAVASPGRRKNPDENMAPVLIA